MPCRIWNALNGESAAPVLRSGTTRAADVRRCAERVGVDDAVIADVRLVQPPEALGVLRPRKLARIDDRAAEARAVPAEILRQRMDDDIRAMLERAQQVGRRHRVVDDERQAVAVRDLGERGDIGDVAERIADRFREDRLRPCVDQRVERGRLARVGEARRDSVLRQRMREQVVGAAVQRARRYDVVARLRDRQDRISDGRLARCERERADAAFERRDALLEHVVGRIHDPRIDVALDLQIEQVRAVLRVVERERDRLIDRHRGGARRRIGAIAAVHGEGLEAPVGGCGFGHDGSPVDLLVSRCRPIIGVAPARF